MISAYIWFVMLLLFGVWLLYWRKKRKYDRLNEHGREAFGSYLEKVRADAFDTLLLWVGCVCLIGAVIMLGGE
jgi:hypothetical protein